jgi:hypothetical protein
MIDIEHALRDPQLLGAALGDPETWSTWLTALKAAFGIELNREERRAFESIAGNRAPPARKVQQFFAICGRGSGKSRIAAAIAVYIACFIEHDLDPGEVGYVLSLSASRDQAAVVFSYALAFLEQSPILRQQIESITATEIRLKSNIVISIHTSSFRLVRGRALLGVIFDELAWWRSDESANPDIEIFRACLPSLIRTHGTLVGISSPYRRTGLLHQKFKTSYGIDDPDVLVVRGGTSEFNPTINRDDIQKALLADPEAARSEWLAEFRSDITALFDDTVIEAAIDYARPLELPPCANLKYYTFVDASAGRHDAFACCILHADGKPPDAMTWTCDVVRGRPAPFDPRSTAHEFATLARQYRCSKVTGDLFAGEWVAGAFKDAGINYETSPLPKSQLYLEALPHFNRGAIRIPDLPVLLRELRSLERRVHRSGRDSVDHPPRGSDDYANVVCGALNVATRETRKPGMSWGTIDFAGTGKVTWRHDEDEPRQHSRVKIVHMSEREWIEAKEKEHLT